MKLFARDSSHHPWHEHFGSTVVDIATSRESKFRPVHSNSDRRVISPGPRCPHRTIHITFNVVSNAFSLSKMSYRLEFSPKYHNQSCAEHEMIASRSGASIINMRLDYNDETTDPKHLTHCSQVPQNYHEVCTEGDYMLRHESHGHPGTVYTSL
ncbi:hypothetical protein K439DRAFT_272872 [Ramaria rubella]|nr:hypothetical protein K439DRAFT_272872 [Ramaria rubella]